MMDEKIYAEHARQTFEEVSALFDDIDADDADLEPTGDVLKIIFADGSVCVLNTQRPARQLWLAADARAWHFNWDTSEAKWLDDRNPEAELVNTVKTICAQHGVEL